MNACEARNLRLAAFFSLLAHAVIVVPALFGPRGAPVTPVEIEMVDTRVSEAVVTLLPDLSLPAPVAPALPVNTTLQPRADVVSPPLSGGNEASEIAGPWAPPARGNSGPGLGEGTTQFFQVPGHGASVVYVIDCSSSMGLHGALDAAKREMLASLQRLAESVRFQVIAYHRSAEPLHIDGHRDLIPATAANKLRAAELIKELQARGGSAHETALRRALELRPEVIYYLTDAGELSVAQVWAVTKMNHGRTAIHAIELTPDPHSAETSALPLLAAKNRGVYRAVSRGENAE